MPFDQAILQKGNAAIVLRQRNISTSDSSAFLSDVLRVGDFSARWKDELKFMREYRSLLADPAFTRQTIDGRGQPVILTPGLCGGNWIESFRPMEEWLKRNNFTPINVGISLNTLHPAAAMDKIAAKVRSAHEETKMKPILLGNSLGGIENLFYARYHSSEIKSNITICTPHIAPIEINSIVKATIMGFAWAFGSESVAKLITGAMEHPIVPTISVRAKYDGVVKPESCVRPGIENIEVDATHLGALVNPNTFKALARVLA